MALFIWKDSYSCGLNTIDEQHKIIGELINKVYNSIRSGTNSVVIKEVFIELLKYANYHFELETQLFNLYQYPGEEKHIEQHKHFVKKIQMLMIKDFLTGKDDLLETLQFLIEWFKEHILKTDREYCEYFKFREVLQDAESFVQLHKYISEDKVGEE